MDAQTHAAGPRAEAANSITHGLGALLSLLALFLLVGSGKLRGDARDLVGSLVFGATLVLLYTMSTLYHALTHKRAKRVFQILDHSAIYLLIAGTYTPFCLTALRGSWGWSLLGLVWGIALAGIVFKAFYADRFGFLSTAVYLAMSWMVMIAIVPLWHALHGPGMVWLMAGGVSYTFGVVFYAWHRLRFHHAVWHVFVMGGSICHVVAVLGFVLPRPA